jgi:hypothetical protein
MRSRIVELDAATGAISIRFQGAGKAAFFTAILGKQQLLDNGNLLVTAAHERRVFEVAPDGALLWEYKLLVNGLLTEGSFCHETWYKRHFEGLTKCSRPE